MDEINKYLDNYFTENVVTRENMQQKRGELIKYFREMGKYEMSVIGKTIGMYFSCKFPKVKKDTPSEVVILKNEDAKKSSEDDEDEEEEVYEETGERAATRDRLREAFMEADHLGFQIHMAQLLEYQRDDNKID